MFRPIRNCSAQHTNLQATTKVKTSSGVELNRESIYITHIVTDEDGNLKVKVSEEFTDSQAYLDLIEAAIEAKVKEQNSVA